MNFSYTCNELIIMNLEHKKREVLEQLSQMQKEKRRSRRAIKDTGKKKSPQEIESYVSVQKEKQILLIYGAKSFFIKGLMQSLKNVFELIHCTDSEEACAICMEKDIPFILLDMDHPTDWKKSTDIFTNVNMISQETLFFLATKKVNSHEVQTLVSQGGIVTEKPINIKDITDHTTTGSDTE